MPVLERKMGALCFNSQMVLFLNEVYGVEDGLEHTAFACVGTGGCMIRAALGIAICIR